jgi:hypothetical protein
MNNDLAGDTAVWRALFGAAQSPILLLFVYLSSLFSKSRRNDLRRIMGPSLETGAVFDAVLSVNYCAIVVACL